MTTIYQVAKLAGVSLSSVSRVLNNHAHVSSATKAKVLAAIEQLDYHPNFIARSLASHNSNNIGILVANIGGPFYSNLLGGAEQALTHYQKQAVIMSASQSPKQAIERLIERHCDALIICVDDIDEQYLVELSQSKITLVIVNRYISAIANHCIYIDQQTAQFKATEYLIKKGHQQIAYIAGPNNNPHAQQRLKGHIQALTQYQHDRNSPIINADYSYQGGRLAISELLKQHQFSAVVCANDEMAAGVIGYAREQQLKIPQHFAVMGFDNLYFSHYLAPELSTVEHPINAMAQMAVKLVMKLRYQQKLNITHQFDTHLVLRDST